MRTRAALVNIQALSAELWAAAVCCSSLARRAAVSVDGLGAGFGATAEVCAATTDAKVHTSKAIPSQAISLFLMDTYALLLGAESPRRIILGRLTVSLGGARRKSKL